jgi:hypothetical protein
MKKLGAVVVQISCIVSSTITVQSNRFLLFKPTTLSDLPLALYNSCSENPLVELTHFSSIKRNYSCRLLCLYAYLLLF